VGRNNHESRDHITTIERRIGHLKWRIETQRGSENSLHRDRAEYAALSWAVQICRLWMMGNERD
jgi:hypothetical protein